MSLFVPDFFLYQDALGRTEGTLPGAALFVGIAAVVNASMALGKIYADLGQRMHAGEHFAAALSTARKRSPQTGEAARGNRRAAAWFACRVGSVPRRATR
ncbi:MAG: hypothetical protein U0166_18005 [Acidobacteriota bacterium]